MDVFPILEAASIAVRLIPDRAAITRSLTPQAYFRRRTSRIFRIGNLSAGIRLPLHCPVQIVDNATRLTYQQGRRFRSDRGLLCLGFRSPPAIIDGRVEVTKPRRFERPTGN